MIKLVNLPFFEIESESEVNEILFMQIFLPSISRSQSFELLSAHFAWYHILSVL